MRIGIDCDDVLCDFTKMYTTICYKLFGSPLPGTQPVDWEWSNYGLTKEQQDQAWAVVKKFTNFWLSLPEQPGFTPSILDDLDDAHELFFITARVDTDGASTQYQTARWIADRTSLLPTVIVSHDKGEIAKALKLDAFIDDRPKNCIEVKEAVPNCRVFLKDSSHNAGFNSDKFVRVPSFDAFADMIMTMEG